ncbi:MAG: substrate-binding domain-containing protein [Chlorobium sp.]|uniref:substrate-binding domain-containing protein n=1 Tax=Chlorobium sp. TaxID=1095 RepID=UPI0025BAC6AB|nr:substrate-binding domain-containing protein [Chlorobium sp.]MCF8382429.1 substrate-binding domain-containing protein [Chlorobium sp.]
MITGNGDIGDRERPICAATGKGVALTRSFVAAILFALSISGCRTDSGADDARLSATAGKLRLAVDASIAEAADAQAKIFAAHYPDAVVSVTPELTGKTLLTLLKKESGAALLNGSLLPEEDSLLAHPRLGGRKEPVARDALICIVNRNSSLDSVTTGALGAVLAARKSSKAEFVLWTARNDYRLLATLRQLLGTGNTTLHAMQTDSDSLLVEKTAADPLAAGLLYLSAWNTLSLPEKTRNGIRILPVASEKAGSSAVMPSEQYIYDGRYPLATIVYYIYIPGNPLAAGFGSWLSREGQKGFERSYLAPFRQLPRTIILK